MLNLVGLLCSLVVVFRLIYGLHPIVIAFVAAIGGVMLAETNALRTRMAQWPIFKQYIDWQRVHEDLGDTEQSAPVSGADN